MCDLTFRLMLYPHMRDAGHPSIAVTLICLQARRWKRYGSRWKGLGIAMLTLCRLPRDDYWSLIARRDDVQVNAE